jgi:hypothetical protein
MLARINKLIEDVLRDPFTGIGKPEPLKYHLPGAWSRRIDDEQRARLRRHGSRDHHPRRPVSLLTLSERIWSQPIASAGSEEASA